MKVFKYLMLLMSVFLIDNDVYGVTKYTNGNTEITLGSGDTLIVNSNFSGNLNLNGNNITIIIDSGYTLNKNLDIKDNSFLYNYGNIVCSEIIIGKGSIFNNINSVNSTKIKLNENSHLNNFKNIVVGDFESDNNSLVINNDYFIQNNTSDFKVNGKFINNGYLNIKDLHNQGNGEFINNCNMFSKGFINGSLFTNNGYYNINGRVHINYEINQSKEGVIDVLSDDITLNAKLYRGHYKFNTSNGRTIVVNGSTIFDEIETFYDSSLIKMDGSIQNFKNNIGGIKSFIPKNTIEYACTDSNFIVKPSVKYTPKNDILKIGFNRVDSLGVPTDISELLIIYNNNNNNNNNNSNSGVFWTYDNDSIYFNFIGDKNGLGDLYHASYLVYKNGKFAQSNLTIILSTTLPVELISFSGNIENDIIKLSFITASEKNNLGFSIERSSDGVNFEEIGFVDGNGNSSTPIEYTFTDYHPNNGINYYRLKQIDYDGVYEYSKIIFIETNKSNSISELYPNPFSNSFFSNQKVLAIRDLINRDLKFTQNGDIVEIENYNGVVIIITESGSFKMISK